MCILFFLSFSFSVFSISFIFFLSVFPKYPLSIFIPFARMVKVVQFHSALCLFIIIFISTIIHLIDEWMKGWTLEFRWFGRLSFFSSSSTFAHTFFHYICIFRQYHFQFSEGARISVTQLLHYSMEI